MSKKELIWLFLLALVAICDEAAAESRTYPALDFVGLGDPLPYNPAVFGLGEPIFDPQVWRVRWYSPTNPDAGERYADAPLGQLPPPFNPKCDHDRCLNAHDRCIILLGRNDTPMYYHPQAGVECDTAKIGRIPPQTSLRKTAYTSGCFLRSSEQIAVRERWANGQPPVVYSLNGRFTKELRQPFNYGGLFTQESTTAAVGPAHCLACGGGYWTHSRKWSFTDRCFQLAAARSAWQQIRALPQPLCCAASATLAGRFYVIGGWSGGEHLKEMYSYDPQQRRWRQEPSLAVGRAFHAAAVLSSSELLVCGGGRLRSDCAVYDSANKRWSDTHRMQRGRHEFGLIAFDGRVYALGGEGGGRTVEVYDRQHGWKMVKSLERDCAGCVVVGV